jgi:nucleoside 2-deoxyribosyltransferase
MTDKRIRVLMPIGSDPAYRAKQIEIAEAAAANGYVAVFPSYDPAEPNFHLDQFVDDIGSSTIVVADLTGERPSVYFELGVVQALGKPVIIMASTGVPLHQHAAGAQMIRYENIEDMKQRLAAALAAFECKYLQAASE